MMSITELEQSLSTLNAWRLACFIAGAIAAVGTVVIHIQYIRLDEQLRAARTEQNLRQRERIASIENDTARALVLLAWRRLKDTPFRIFSDGLKQPKINNLHVAALEGDPEAKLFANDILRATKDAGYDIRMGHIFNSTPYVGLNISGPAQDVARLAALFAQAGFSDLARQELAPGSDVQISVGSKPPPKSN
jgi:hypothetical protein